MKNIISLICAFLLVSCQSRKQFNAQLNQPISVSKLQKDVDFSYKKLKQLHPKLYWYISKKNLDFKFDSLKKSIKQPMTGLAFYKEISQVTKCIGQGHLGVSPSLEKKSKKEVKALKSKGKSAFSQFDFEFIDNKLIIRKNRSQYNIKENTEVVAINNENPSELMRVFAKRTASDGYNSTFFNRFIGENFPFYYTLHKGKLQDSLQFLLKFDTTDSLIVVKRDTFRTKNIENKIKLSKKERKEKAKFNSKYGYNEDKKTFTREFKFIENDSTTALMSIKSFSNGDFYSFYEESFAKLSVANTKNLIIDLRNNPGGRLAEIEFLYSYLMQNPYVFIDDYEVVSKTSFLHMNYFKGGNIGIKLLKFIGAPVFYSLFYLKTYKKNEKVYLHTKFSKLRNPKPTNFKGKIYVLINGGSFSASSIISSNLKFTKRAFFVGEETSGAFNGTVAAQIPSIQLPNSKVNLKIGLASVCPNGKSEIEGRGILPDKEIIPTFTDRQNNFDPELNWILQDIKSEK